jgi:ABC-type transport system involved in multi-copper enzyme maturation permease subunit
LIPQPPGHSVAIPPPPAPGTQHPAPGTLSASPFGWTGIKRERYTRWNGHLDSRRKITLRMVKEGVRFNIKTWPVILLLLLAWMITVFFPVFFAAMGGLPLEADIPDTWTGSQPANAIMHRTIMNYSAAEYPLVGSAVTGSTTYNISQVPSGWATRVDITGEDGRFLPVLTVVPPADALPFTNATIQVKAVTGPREDNYLTFTMVAPAPELANISSSYDFAFANDTFHGKAGETSIVQFSVTNTGTLAEGFSITVTTKQTGWGLSAYVNGSRVPVVLVSEDQISFGTYDFVTIVHAFEVELRPGEAAPCELRISTTTQSPAANDIMIGIRSQDDRASGGSFHTGLMLTDTKKTDRIGSVLYDQVMSTQVWFALLLAAVVGSRMISTDLSEKSYNLYFARPLTKSDYLAGKFGTVGVILALVTIVPTLVTYGFILLLSNISTTYVVDHLWVWGAIVGQGLVVVLTFSTLSLAFSSLTARRFYAAAAMVVIYLVTTIMGQIVMGAFDSKYGRLIGISDDFDIVGRTAFNITGSTDWGFPWYYSLAALAAIWTVCTFLVWYKVERTELSE